jgi:hypothetical protein
MNTGIEKPAWSSDYSRKQPEIIVVAQDDDEDYSESGWVAFTIDYTTFYLARYSHCSCFGTWTALADDGGGTLSANWSGTRDELIRMATESLDPDMPTRQSNAEDYDHDHLVKVYAQIIEWAKQEAAK